MRMAPHDRSASGPCRPHPTRARLRPAAIRRCTCLLAVLALGAAGVAGAQEAPPTDPEAPSTGPASSQSRLWQAAETVVESPYHRLSLDLRQRIEVAKQDDFQRSEAYTLRTRAGLGSQPWQGFSVFGELENVVSYDDGSYFNTSLRSQFQKAPMRLIIFGASSRKCSLLLNTWKSVT